MAFPPPLCTYGPDDVDALVEAARSVLDGDDPCPDCGQEPGEGEGLCETGCRRNALVIALRPFAAKADGGGR